MYIFSKLPDTLTANYLNLPPHTTPFLTSHATNSFLQSFHMLTFCHTMIIRGLIRALPPLTPTCTPNPLLLFKPFSQLHLCILSPPLEAQSQRSSALMVITAIDGIDRAMDRQLKQNSDASCSLRVWVTKTNQPSYSRRLKKGAIRSPSLALSYRSRISVLSGSFTTYFS
jgi:hypothetical protein